MAYSKTLLLLGLLFTAVLMLSSEVLARELAETTGQTQGGVVDDNQWGHGQLHGHHHDHDDDDDDHHDDDDDDDHHDDDDDDDHHHHPYRHSYRHHGHHGKPGHGDEAMENDTEAGEN